MENSTSVVLNQLLENDLLTACRERLPYETCGIVYGTAADGIVTAEGYAIVRNGSSSPSDTFSFHPEDWVSAYFQAQKNQRNIVGLFHTHPQGSSVPSTGDEQGSIPWKTYWIVGFANGKQEISIYVRGTHAQWISLPIKHQP
ncbi:Mov34/MPN/PAD-1 family protein [Cohnella silvisoli]|uniref:Mov34/MPN/PAD-1 family protein n=1 Tax=Cohnella silvisoli TaxID=2873699 RepID=A0ABV1KP49_9BACL|nr:Mov34/MPN/PAD-1 family protein [Cohnella silvisoli]MCD9025629.1 Mov34/MPN/PAD-1 family protein [Cohnella silvisoli]